MSFLRNSAQTGAIYQVFTGELARMARKTYMTGSFYNVSGDNDTGSFGFTASAVGPSRDPRRLPHGRLIDLARSARPARSRTGLARRPRSERGLFSFDAAGG